MALSAERRQALREEAEFLRAFPPEALKPDGHTFIELEAALTEAEELLSEVFQAYKVDATQKDEFYETLCEKVIKRFKR